MIVQKAVRYLICLFGLSISWCGILLGQENASNELELDNLKIRGISVLSEYLKLDTSNPPGNETLGVEFLGAILEKEGIEYKILESAPDRANLYARLKGNGRKPALILMHHIDVVPADDQFWEVPPFSGEIKDDYLWGRGAMDMKGLGIVQLMTMLALNRSQDTRERDVIFLATADEERGGFLGVNWLVENHLSMIEDAEFALNEGGMNLIRDGRIAYVGIEVTQKTPLWVRLTVQGQSGHGSVPKEDSANSRLVRALNRILDWKTETRFESVIGRFFESIAPFQEEPLRSALLGSTVSEMADPLPETVRYSLLGPYFQALARNTVSLTVLKSGEATNVMPAVAQADLDCRLLPGEDPEAFLNQLVEVIADPAVQAEVLLAFSSSHAPEESAVFDSVLKVTRELEPSAVVGISVLPGFTDSHVLREKGIPAYGFSPFRIEESEPTGAHTHNEKISIKAFEDGLDFFYAVVADLVFQHQDTENPESNH